MAGIVAKANQRAIGVNTYPASVKTAAQSSYALHIDGARRCKVAKFLFVDDLGHIDVELWVTAETEKQARRTAWLMLTDEQRDACGCLDCVDEVAA